MKLNINDQITFSSQAKSEIEIIYVKGDEILLIALQIFLVRNILLAS